ncbi:MAG TPA: alpha-glucuronidase family glycosyl hydrolase [Cyclobacteriaceae bacterium]|nr:alpha-glucuronidase family glycosyl hydrolase [Cyclobacteriaceae bacterium]
MTILRKLLLALVLTGTTLGLKAEDGYRLWLRYDKVDNAQKVGEYRQAIKNWMAIGNTPTMTAAKEELQLGLGGLLGSSISGVSTIKTDGVVIIGNANSPELSKLDFIKNVESLGDEGYLIFTTTINRKKVIVITGRRDVGVLYGTFHFLRLLQTQQNISDLSIQSVPRVKLRILNHWDNLDRTVERGYAGFSIWDWHKLPDYIDPRYKDYARANASIGINGSVVTNVNANALVLTPPYLEKVAALANVFRPYGIKIYLTARFSAPIEIGGLKTADPLDQDVRKWWKDKVAEIYKYVPDFGGFVVKANSEGQPGPQNYGRTHGDGSNILAEALEPFHGVVMWRAFVYDNNVPDDRHKQAYNEFKPLDGTLKPNVLVQVKNGAIDFQPREPFHPLFGAMPKTPLMMEFQITQEYLGFATHLVYLATLFKECLDSDTYAKGQGSTVAKVIDGTLDNHSLSGMCGVANIGTDRNWCGHPFGQANWYSFGRLAWDHQLTADQIADEWIRMTFNNKTETIAPIKSIMLTSRETVVDYMTPLGLHHIMGVGHHYGPGPWVNAGRADWTSVYYHRADSTGIGFDRTATGSNAVSQYFPPVEKIFSSLELCPEKYLLWFHHVKWDYKTKSGKSLWDALCYKYSRGVDSVRWMQKTWSGLENKIDNDRFNHVKMLLTIQEKEAVRWRNSCLLYFQTFSKLPIPAELEKPEHTLDYYEKLSFPYAPGIRPRW